ncbi:MAG: hypothetical protein NNA25_13175 [Nitrospira sp.]|nr:hypothetical protein [Nitrospira sp.]
MRINELPHKKRRAVLIGTHDLNFGIKLADWLASRGYQAVLIRSWATMLDECRELRPQAVVIDDAQTAQATAPCLAHLVRSIEALYPHAVIIARGAGLFAAPSSGEETSSLRLIRVCSADFAHIGRLVHTELNRDGAPSLVPTTKVASSPKPPPSSQSFSLPTEDTDGRMVCHRCQGLMHPIDPLDPLDAMRTGKCETMQAWRCISCGNLIDPIIIQNRRIVMTSRARRRGTSPRQPVFRGVPS